MRRSFLLALLCCSLALVAGRASAQVYLYSGFESQQHWTPPYPEGGTFKSLKAAYGNGDELPDALMRQGEHLVFFQNPAQDHRFWVLSRDARAYALLPSGAARRDGILVSESDRLVLRSWKRSDDGFLELELHNAALGAGARALEILPQDTAPSVWVGGLAADGRTLFLGTLDLPAKTRALRPDWIGFRQVSSFTLAEDVRAWELTDWDGTGQPEFAVQTSVMQVYTAQGTGLWSTAIVAAASQPLIERFHDEALGKDRLCWVTGDAVGGSALVVLDERFDTLDSGNTLEPALPAADLGSLGFCDYDLDGIRDLWFSVKALPFALLYYGTVAPVFPDDETFLPDLENRTTQFYLNAGSPLTPTVASLGDVQDFDLDGDVDFLFVSDDYVHLNYLRGDSIQEEENVPQLLGFTRTVIEEPGIHQLEFELVLSTPVARGIAPTSLAIEVFYQPNLTAEISSEPRQVAEPPASAEPFTAPIAFSILGDSPEAVYQFRFRPLDAQGRQVGPALIEYYANNPTTFLSLQNQINDWGVDPLDNGGNGFHRRATIGPFCASCR